MDRQMDKDMLNQGLQLVQKAAHILEGISNDPPVTPYEFFAALDSLEILNKEERAVLMKAAATVELTLEDVTKVNSTTH
tara:strand:- start:1647 stop:1883 length:237 start_codon:yes stop_codon:yes gene_type:complete